MFTTINEFREMYNDIVITIPKSIKWSEYEKELSAAADGDTLNFKVNFLPKTSVGNKCYVCYNNQVIGYHVISGLSKKTFKCTTTGNDWSGNFIERTGIFHRIEPIPMRGFQGFRYFKNISQPQ